MVDEGDKPAAGDGPENGAAAEPETEENTPKGPEPEPETGLAGWFDRDMLRAVMSGAAAAVVGATIIGLAAFVWGSVAEWRVLPPDTWPDFAAAAGAALETVKGWQVVLVGLFIFVSLMAAVSRNARYAREHIDRNARHVLDRDREILDQRRKSLAAALKAEIAYLGVVCKLRARYITEKLSKEGKKTFVMSEHRRDEAKVGAMTIYEANGDCIGLLPPKAAQPVVTFYSLIAHYNLTISGGVISEPRKDDMEDAAELAKEANDALQTVIEGKSNS